MPSASRKRRSERSLNKKDLPLSGSRLEGRSSLSRYSRFSETSGYVEQRRKRARKKRILIGSFVTLFALLIAGATAAFGLVIYMNNALVVGIDMPKLQDVLVNDQREPGDPFWILLVGTDNRGIHQAQLSDTIILARIDPVNKKAALVSIPRDTRVFIPDYGYQKINAAYAYGVQEEENGNSGPKALISAVTDLTGIGVSYYAHVDMSGFKKVVDALGGVEVEVPMDIIDDRKAGPVDVYAGTQVLDGEHALVFVRSRQYEIGDYQRQTNQRTFLQALATQTVSADPVKMIDTVTKVCEMTSTNLSVGDIADIADDMRGIQESDIYTCTLPCYGEMIDNLSFEIPDEEAILKLFASINEGKFPELDEIQRINQGEMPESYKPNAGKNATDQLENKTSKVKTSKYMIAVRNGGGVQGSATSVSDMLALAGYEQGEIGNANSSVYTETLIIYREESDKAAAEDIQKRLGFGRIIPSQDRYVFEGNILVVVGEDIKNHT